MARRAHVLEKWKAARAARFAKIGHFPSFQYLRLSPLLRSLAMITLVMFLATMAQWVIYPARGIPRLPDGKPNLSARAPAKDLSGTWTVPYTTLGPDGPPRYATFLAADLPEGSVPLKPIAREVVRRRFENLGKDNPFARCLPPGLPMATLQPAPFKIVQNPGLTIILYETRGLYRQIFTDGRSLPEDPNPSWMGYSIGQWEGDEFVIDSAGFNDRTWLDGIGFPHGEHFHLVERFQRRDFGHMDLRMTIHDDEFYEQPWSIIVRLELTPDTELLEDVCLNENERMNNR
jgi:hypothetical protein